MISVRPLPPALAEKARVELGETPEALTAGIQHLKDWIHSQPHLRARTDDQWLATFLRGCKYRLDEVKAKIDLYYSLRTMAPEIRQLKYNDPKLNQLIERGTFVMLPTTRNGARITMMRIGTYDPSEYTVFDMASLYQLVYQITFMEDDNMAVAGVVNIIDLRNSRLAHYLQTTPRQLRNLVYANQDSLPARIKEVHVIGAPRIFIVLMKFIKRFLSEKIKNRIYMHSDIDTVCEYVPRDLLPAEYGGTASTVPEIGEYWKAKIAEYYDFFEEDLQFGTEESLRVKDSFGWWGKRAALRGDT
ncbi:alpha-tocopherol transfer protein-like isoform X2 [Aricia agestis]|nr:alpha-tocopherol transfer protein-like isoform X2 [Aricia agestis]